MKSYFSGLSRAGFKRDKQGNRVFYPWGVFGKGRILPDEQTERSVDSFMRRCYVLVFAVVLSPQLLPDWRWGLAAAIVLLLYWFQGLRSRLTGCAYSEERLNLKEAYASQALAMSGIVLWTLLLVSVLFCLLGIYSLLLLPDRHASVGWLLIGIFAPSILLFSYLLRLKRLGKSRDEI